MTEATGKPSVLFVRVNNGRKSQMAAGLMRKIAGDAVQVHSAGTRPGNSLNALSAQSLAEVGVDIRDETPKPVDPQLVRDVDIVVTLGREAHVEPVTGTAFENWDTDEWKSTRLMWSTSPRSGGAREDGKPSSKRFWRACGHRPRCVHDTHDCPHGAG